MFYWYYHYNLRKLISVFATNEYIYLFNIVNYVSVRYLGNFSTSLGNDTTYAVGRPTISDPTSIIIFEFKTSVVILIREVIFGSVLLKLAFRETNNKLWADCDAPLLPQIFYRWKQSLRNFSAWQIPHSTLQLKLLEKLRVVPFYTILTTFWVIIPVSRLTPSQNDLELICFSSYDLNSHELPFT